MIKIKTDKKDEELRDISEVKIDLTELINILKRNLEKIESISVEADSMTVFLYGDKEAKGKDELIKMLSEEVKNVVPMNINL
jgi:CRISPR-associated protein Csh2